MLFGYQPFATRDPRIFEDAEVFVPRRFVGEGEKMLKHVLWSNGRETEEPSASNKQCPGKNLVVLLCRLFLVELFLRYDTFEFEYTQAGFGPTITIKSLTKASTIWVWGLLSSLWQRGFSLIFKKMYVFLTFCFFLKTCCKKNKRCFF